MSINRLEKLLEFVNNEPNDPFLKYALATEYLSKNDSDKALHYYQDLVLNHPDYVGTYYHFGKLLEKLNKQPEALDIYQKGILVAKKIKDQHSLNELMGVYHALNDDLEDF